MADQKINALPTKTSPSTGDKMLMIGTAEEYQIDYDQLATAILNKLSTQSFSSLDTTSKTVLGAIDELNSNISSGSFTPILTGGVTLTSGECQWYKIKNFVFITAALWLDSSGGTTDNFSITNAPFTASSIRAYGTVGYLVNLSAYPGLCAGINNNNKTINFSYGTSGGTALLHGDQAGGAIQFSVCYLTNE